MNKYLKIYWILSLITVSASAQQLSQAVSMPQVMPPSPTVANMMYFEEVPVDLYTGQPDIAIPLYSKKINSELTLPIALRYSTLGVRLDERSGWSGTGWSLEAAGAVSRTVRGGADELKPFGQYKTWGVHHNPKFWNYDNLSNKDKHRFNWNANGTKDTVYEHKPDLYQVSALGMTARFLVVNSGGILRAKKLSDDQRLKIDVFHDMSSFVISSFIITDANGYKYVFNAIETSLSDTNTFVYPQKNLGTVAPQPGLPPLPMNSAWHLTAIRSSNNEDLVTFTYKNSEEEYDTPISGTSYKLQGTNWTEELNSERNQSIFRPAKINTHFSITTNTKKLYQIKFKDNTLIRFNTSSENSHPENKGVYLSNIQVLNSAGQEVKRVQFYQYITNGRLWLDRVSVAGEMFTLDYFEEDLLPPPDVNDDVRGDRWGYNNGDFRHSLDYGYYYYDTKAIKRGLLKQIKYPTGGTKDFTFEPHTFSYEGDQEIDNFDSNYRNSTIQTYGKSFSTSQNIPSHTVGSIVLSQDQYLRVNVNNISGSPNVFWLRFYKGTMYHQVEISSASQLVQLTQGTYTIKVVPIIGEIVIPPYKTLSGYIDVTYVTKTPWQYCSSLIGGGVRIAAISFNDSISSQPLKRKIVYNYEKFVPGDGGLTPDRWMSTGVVDTKLGSMFKEYEIQDRKILYTNSSESDVSVQNINYSVESGERNVYLAKGGYVGYKNVRVYETNGPVIQNSFPSTVDYTEYIYSTAQDWPTPSSAFEYPFITPPNYDYKRGLLLSKTIYNKSNQKLEEIINNYEYKQDSVLFTMDFEHIPCEWRQLYEGYDSYIDKSWAQYPMLCYIGGELGPVDCFGGVLNNCAGNNVVAPYYVYKTPLMKGRSELKSSISRKFFYDGGTQQLMERTTNYEYNEDNFQMRSGSYTINEGNTSNTYKTEYEYPVGGYTTTLFPTPEQQNTILEMNDRNMVNKPLVITNSKNNTVLQRVINKYAEFPNDLILPKNIHTYKTSNDTITETRINYSNYNAIGNVQEVSMSNGQPVSYLWAYHGTVPVAKLEGISYTGIPSSLRNSVEGATTEATLRTALENLQTQYLLNNLVQVTTFLQDPYKGIIIETTDPKGERLKYEYDNRGRLISVRDKEDRLLSENKYNFRP